MLIKHKQKCGIDNITTIKTSPDSRRHWKQHFHKNPLYFRIYADFEADNEKDNSIIGNKTTNFYKQNPVLNGYHIVSQLEDVLKSDCYKSPFGYDNVDWFVDEVTKLENKMAFYFKNTKKEINMKDEDKEDYRNDNVCRFCEKEILSDKVRDHCHLTGKYRGPAHKKCNNNVTQDQSNFIPIMYHDFMFFKKLVDKKIDEVEFEIIPKTNEEYISVTYGCVRFFDSYRFLSSVLGSLVKTLVDIGLKKIKNLKKQIVDKDEILDIVNKIVEDDRITKDLKRDYPNEIKNLEEALLDYMGENDFETLKTGFPDKWKYLTKKLAYPNEYFNSIDDYQKPVDILEKKDFFSKLKNKCPDAEEIEITKENIKIFDFKNGEELTEIYLKSDVLLLACVFEKFIKVSINEFKINPLNCVSLPGYTWQCGLKNTGINLQTLQDKDMIFLLEINIRGGISSVMGDRYTKTDENKKILYVDANILYGLSMSEPLPYDEIKFDKNVTLEDILNTPDVSGIGDFVEVDLIYPDNIKEKTKKFPFAPVNKKINPDNFNDYMKEIKPDTYIETSKLICDWSDRKNYLIHYRMLKFYVRHGMIVDKVHEIISFKQSKWLEKNINFITQKRNQAVNDDFEKDFYKLLNNAFYSKTMENVRNRLKIKFAKKDEYREIIKQQSKLTFNGIHKSYEKCDSYTFKQNEVLMDKPIHLGFSVLELSKLLMYETYYDKLQPYFGQENFQLHYMDTDSFVLSVNTKDIIKDLKNLENVFDFSNLDKNHELFSNKNEKVTGKYKIETPKNIWIDEFICLRSKMYAFKSGDDSKNKLKGIFKSHSKNIKFEENIKCLDSAEYQQECNNYIIRSINHEMCLQEVKKSTLSIFDVKRCYLKNIESEPWN